MKRLILSLLLLSPFLPLSSQNIQLHYDFGKGRHFFTSTVEMFKPDKYGSTFFFIDMDYNSGGIKGIGTAYWEIARAIKFPENPVALHVEYNGGLGQFKDITNQIGFTINDSWLGGIEFSKDSKDFSKGFTLQALYKYIRGKQNASFQITGVWYLNFSGNKFSFTGFADFWRENMTFPDKNGNPVTTQYVFQAEPQIWYNFSKNFAAGSEVEISNNFAGNGFWIMPTMGVKATF
jgi:hypothetical protein